MTTGPAPLQSMRQAISFRYTWTSIGGKTLVLAFVAGQSSSRCRKHSDGFGHFLLTGGNRRMRAAMTNWPNGETLVVFIVGDPVAQVKSPAAITAQFASRGVNAAVLPAHVAPEHLAHFMAGIGVLRNSPGVVFTVPHKQAALRFCKEVTTRARIAGSVNVARRVEGGWAGDNTDGVGYLDGIARVGGTATGRRVLLVGAGGAGSAIAHEFLARGAGMLAIHDIDAARRDALIDRLQELFPGKVMAGSDDPSGFDIIANATPLGMRPSDPYPVDVGKLTADQFAACAITSPDPSPFIAAAQAKGCRTMTGSAMFKAQEKLLAETLLGPLGVERR
jgi:shikimate dehydrogenase